MMHVIIGGGSATTRSTSSGIRKGSANSRDRVRSWTPQRASELTGLTVEEIVGLAREYATTRPAAIRLNYGVQRSERGAMAVRTIALLPALIGSWKEVGRRRAALDVAGVPLE